MDGASVAMYAGTNPEPVWKARDVLQGQTGMVLCGAHAGPPAVLCCSPDARMAVVGSTGSVLASIQTNGLVNHGAAMSGDGRFVAAATFTADVKVHEIQRDRSLAFTGAPKVFELKGHTSQVTALAFSADGTRAVTASKDGTWRVWKLDVRYTLNEDPKCLHTVGACRCVGMARVVQLAYAHRLRCLSSRSRFPCWRLAPTASWPPPSAPPCTFWTQHAAAWWTLSKPPTAPVRRCSACSGRRGRCLRKGRCLRRAGPIGACGCGAPHAVRARADASCKHVLRVASVNRKSRRKSGGRQSRQSH